MAGLRTSCTQWSLSAAAPRGECPREHLAVFRPWGRMARSRRRSVSPTSFARFVMAVAYATVAGSGCGRSGVPAGPPRLPTVAAAGVLTVRGQPVAGATVVMHHAEGRASAIGTTDAEGRFTLTTYQKDDGAPAGHYRVTVAKNDTTEVEPGVLAPLSAEPTRPTIPLSYGNPDTSGLTCEIPPDGNTEIRVDLK